MFSSNVNSTAPAEQRFIIDSGCKGAHICTDVRMLSDPTKQKQVSIRGIDVTVIGVASLVI